MSTQYMEMPPKRQNKPVAANSSVRRKKPMMHTVDMIERLLLADLDSLTNMQNTCQLAQLRKVVRNYAIAIRK